MYDPDNGAYFFIVQLYLILIQITSLKENFSSSTGLSHAINSLNMSNCKGMISTEHRLAFAQSKLQSAFLRIDERPWTGQKEVKVNRIWREQPIS